MKRILITPIYLFLTMGWSIAQPIVTAEDFEFLKGLTQAVLDSSRIRPGQQLVSPFGANNTGGTLIRPGGRETYPSFWIRDYAMTLETGFVTKEEQKHMLLLTASTQCDQSWITEGGSLVPFGAIADHIRVDDLKPIYFPGTYDYDEQGVEAFGMTPPYCDQYYFIYMADYYLRTTKDRNILDKLINGMRLVDRLEIAFKIPPSRQDNHLIYTNDTFRGVDFGFRDAIRITGDLSYPSILKYRAAYQLAAIFDEVGDREKARGYRQIAQQLKEAIPRTFLNKDGMLRASTGKGGQADVWGTALAVYLGILEGENAKQAGQHLAQAYAAGKLAYKGSVRHIIHGEDFSEETAWEDAIVPKNQYQNGAYWGTATGWVVYAIANVDAAVASRLISDYIAGLRESDFRKGIGFSGPYECYFPPQYTRGPVYLTTVSVPYIVLESMRQKRKHTYLTQ
jgi:hypothetical protein